MRIIKFIIIILLSSNSYAGDIYKFDFYNVYSHALEIINNDSNNLKRSYNLYQIDTGFSKNKDNFITALFFRYEVDSTEKYNYSCLKIDSSGKTVEKRTDIKPLFNNPDRPSESCFTFRENIKGTFTSLYDVNYSSLTTKLTKLLYDTKTNIDLDVKDRIQLDSFVRKVKGEPKLYIYSYYKYESEGKTLFACQIINENGVLEAFLENIPEKKEESIFPSSKTSKPKYRCKVSNV